MKPRISGLLAITACVILGYSLLPGQAQAQFSQQGPKLVGTGAVGNALQGYSLSLSADGNTAIVGGPYHDSLTDAVWVYTRSGGVWSQQTKLVGTGGVGPEQLQDWAVSLSGDGDTAIVGGIGDNVAGGGFGANSAVGAVWVFTRSAGVWSQQAKADNAK